MTLFIFIMGIGWIKFKLSSPKDIGYDAFRRACQRRAAETYID